MLKVYAVTWCPHCKKTVEFLNANHIAHRYLDMETQPEDIVQKVIEINGGDDWVVPTLEYNGRWRPGKVFDEAGLRNDLIEMGVLNA